MTRVTLFKLPRRHADRTLIIEFNPYQILVLEISRPRRGQVVIENAAEFNREDVEGLRRWLDPVDSGNRGRIVAICGLVPDRGIVQRESVQPARLSEPGYLEELAAEQQKGRFLTATPFKIRNPKTWTLRALNAVDGSALPASGPARPALVCAIANEETLAVQQRLADNRIDPERVEPGLLSLFGAIYGDLERRESTQAVVVVVIHQSATTAYILGKEGVHTPNPILHGLDSVIESGRKELGEMDESEVQAQLQRGHPDLVKHGAKLVRRIGRDLKHVVDSFEMTTGQPVEEILCAYLPPNLSWLSEPLARAIGRTPLPMNCADWLPSVGVEIAAGGPTFGPHWFGALSLLAHLPEAEPTKGKRPSDEAVFHRPWHIDCSVSTESDDRKAAGRRFIGSAIAATAAAFALVITAWQGYAIYSLRTDTAFWEKQMAGNRGVFDDVNASSARLKAQTAILDRAYDLVGQPYQPTDLFLDLGRTIPPRMQVERIDVNDTRVALSGSVLEPAEDASMTLGRHMDDIRRNPALGPMFANIAITSLQRKQNSDTVTFELTLRFKPDTH